MERRYNVTLKRGVDGDLFNQEMISVTGGGYIPSRSTDTAQEFINSNRIWSYMLTDSEAEQLKKDSRVIDVTIPAKDVPGVIVDTSAKMAGKRFTKRSIDDNGGYYNWGLLRCNNTTDPWSVSSLSVRTDDYDYVLDGTGVDVVIMDSGIIAGHPDFADQYGVSRVKQIDWFVESGVSGSMPATFYTPYEGHGSHVAGIAAGLTQGWARNADIYDMHINLGGDTSGVEPDVGFDLILGWHNNKTNGRPTVVNMSWGTGYAFFKNQLNLHLTNYRGNTTEVLINDQNGSISPAQRLQYYSDYGILPTIEQLYGITNANFSYSKAPFQDPTYDTGVQELIDAGCFVAIAAGNDPHKADVPGGDDYDNTFEISQIIGGSVEEPVYFRYPNIIRYHRPGSPYDDEAMYVGNIDTTYNNNLESLAFSSTRGPAVNICAPGTNIVSAYDTGGDVNPINPTGYYWGNISGTSMASPQVAGVMALYAQLNPNWTMKQMREAVIADSTSNVLYTTNLDNDYNVRNNNDTLLGAPNRMLYNKFGVATDGKATNLTFRNVQIRQRK